MAELKTDVSNESSKKRVREELEDSEANSPDSKLARFDSGVSGVSSPEAKQFQDDLLNFLDEAEPDPGIQDLDSVIRSFEEEILLPEQAPPVATSDSGESRPELGFLLEASDDELGLPPSFSAGEELKIEAVDLTTSGSEAIKLDDMSLGFDNEMPNYEAYTYGIHGESEGNVNVCNGDDFITLGGNLFESYEAGDISEFGRRPASLSAS